MVCSNLAARDTKHIVFNQATSTRGEKLEAEVRRLLGL